ncbi:regulator of volume decrease after cellular swelling-domain-containing protein [Collybia nuda]|uniref:Regulator of volume decrease after cellular swelling-domain-containing protein n=1 Tax=Collybia nuda TaxID=64659 RepID=A0A9P5Y807_9AGAR|nr:regulator of volume decrease after cellular swelling-domain-containing protein [Collybia nuda]
MPAVHPITAVPSFVSAEEHRTLIASTPNSFNDIPAVCRHKEDNVSISLDPALEDFTPQDAAQGTLYVLTSVLVYMSTTGRGFQIEYPAITLHAVSRGEQGPSIYCQLDESMEGVEAAEDGVAEMRELSIVPQNAASLDPIFEALSQCAALHPDPADEGDDDGALDDAFIDSGNFETFTGDEDQELSEVGRAALAHLESIIYDPHDPDSTANGVEGEESVSDEEEDGVSRGVNGK